MTNVRELFERHAAMVFRRCRQLLGDDASAEDAVQEVFVRAMKAIDKFRGDSSEQTWLYRIATTYCLQQMRNAKRQRAKLQLVGAETESSAEAGLLERARVREMLDGLEEADQVIVLGRHVEGMTLDEVADVAGIAKKTVQRRLTKLTQTLRLEDAADGP